MEKEIKYPIGICPKYIWERNSKINRLNELGKAIIRYSDAELNIPIEWIGEYNELIDELNYDKDFSQEKKYHPTFLQTSISLKRVPPKEIKDMRVNQVIGFKEESIMIELNYIGCGDTSKITNDSLIEKIQKSLGDEIF